MVWVGYDDGRELGRETGSSGALPAWVDWMSAAHEHKPANEFPRPPGLVLVPIDKKTGMRPDSEGAETMDELFLEGTASVQPTQLPEFCAELMEGIASSSSRGT